MPEYIEREGKRERETERERERDRKGEREGDGAVNTQDQNPMPEV